MGMRLQWAMAFLNERTTFVQAYVARQRPWADLGPALPRLLSSRLSSRGGLSSLLLSSRLLSSRLLSSLRSSLGGGCTGGFTLHVFSLSSTLTPIE